MNTALWNSPHARSRTARSLTSQTSLNFRPQPEHSTFRLPRWRRIHSFSVLACSSISCR